MLRAVSPVPLTALVVWASACATAEPAPVVRVVGGEPRQQTFVSPYAYEWYIRGELAAAGGDLEAAAEALRRARTGPSDDPFVIARLAEVLDRMDRRAEAERVLDEGLELDPRSEAVWLARARIAARHDEVDRALQAFHRAEQAAPRSPSAPIGLAELLQARGQVGRAEAVLRRYLKRLPEAEPAALRARLELALIRQDRATAVETARLLMRRAPARADAILRTAKLALARGDPVMAADLLAALPDSHAPAALQVEALIAAGRPERAEAVLTAVHPRDVGGLAEQARLYLRVGRAGRSEEVAELANSLGNDPAAHLVAGQATLAQGKWAEAAAHFARVPPDLAATDEAREGLSAALEAQGLGPLAEEIREAQED
ncbi:MAG: tetratricopeptide repeat protein [Myxococcota bacterium]